MHILLVADGRSPTTRRWASALAALGHRITLVSTFPCAPLPGVEADLLMPVAFSSLAGAASANKTALPNPAQLTAAGASGGLRRVVSAFRAPFLAGRYRLGPLTLAYYGPRFRRLVRRVQPDLVHALRIPFEGMLAAYTPPGTPFAVSIWGNDLTLHASGSAQMAALTRRTLTRADGLLADASRDLRLARAWGFDPAKPSLVAPGSAGIDLDEIERVRASAAEGLYDPLLEGFPLDQPLLLNPRGFRTGSVRADTFFKAVPLVLERHPQVTFACAAMAGQPEALRWLDRLNLRGKVHLLPHLPQPHLWRLFLRAEMTLSISQHDGTPNTLLEALACGCFPIAGDIELLREWITPGVNGLLIPPDSPQALAEAILLALDSPALRERAAQINRALIAERAEAGRVRQKIADFYRELAPEPEAEAGE